MLEFGTFLLVREFVAGGSLRRGANAGACLRLEGCRSFLLSILMEAPRFLRSRELLLLRCLPRWVTLPTAGTGTEECEGGPPRSLGSGWSRCTAGRPGFASRSPVSWRERWHSAELGRNVGLFTSTVHTQLAGSSEMRRTSRTLWSPSSNPSKCGSGRLA